MYNVRAARSTRNGPSAGLRTGAPAFGNGPVVVKLRSEIIDVPVNESQAFNLYPSLAWDTQLKGRGVNILASIHCIRRAGSRQPFALDEPVSVFQQSFKRTNSQKFVAILGNKKGVRRGRRPKQRIPFSTPVRAGHTPQALARPPNRPASPRTTTPKSQQNGSTATRVIIMPNLANQELLLPKITASLSKPENQARTAAASNAAANTVAGPSRPATAAPVKNDIKRLPGPVVVNHFRDEDTQDGDLDGVDQKNKCLEYIQRHWNNDDTIQVLGELRDLKRNNKYRAFTRLMPFTSGILDEFAMSGDSANEPDNGPRMNIRDEDTQHGDASGLTNEKDRWIDHVREHLSNSDILQIGNDLEQLIANDKYRAFLRLLPFTAGFIKETFLDSVQ